jgi:hypothetical protein
VQGRRQEGDRLPAAALWLEVQKPAVESLMEVFAQPSGPLRNKVLVPEEPQKGFSRFGCGLDV